MDEKRTSKKLLIMVTAIVMWVYIIWRGVYTIPDGWAMTTGTIFFAVELILIIQSTLFFILLYNPSKYKVPELPAHLPTVDVFIATYNEPNEVLRRTVLASKNLEYPADKLKIWLCDDGRRIEVEALAAELGIHYLKRSNNDHAKAGNLNNALEQSNGDIVVTIDADMVVQPHFLKHTIGFFNDENVGFVQTPQSFFNEDIFQYNRHKNRPIPGEQDLFMQTIQAGRDKFNAAIYVGSNALFRRSALDDVGGFATGTITEDMATGMLIQAKGYRTIAHSEVLAQGLAPESLDDLMSQRVRWARGTIQTMRKWNPLTTKGLTVMQRSLYLSSYLYWFFGIFRLVFLLAPVLYLLVGIPFLEATLTGIFFFWLPYFGLSLIAFKILSGNKGTLFWSNIYETAMMFTVAWAVSIEMIFRKPIKFNVTPKGVQTDEGKWNRVFLAPLLVLFFLTVGAAAKGVWEMSLNLDPELMSGYIINLFWAAYNLVILYFTIRVGYERPRQRQTERFKKKLPVKVIYEDEGKSILVATTMDVSETGCSIRVPTFDAAQRHVTLVLNGEQEHKLHAELVRIEPRKRGCQAHFKFEDMDLTEIQKWMNEVYNIRSQRPMASRRAAVHTGKKPLSI